MESRSSVVGDSDIRKSPVMSRVWDSCRDPFDGSGLRSRDRIQRTSPNDTSAAASSPAAGAASSSAAAAAVDPERPEHRQALQKRLSQACLNFHLGGGCSDKQCMKLHDLNKTEVGLLLEHVQAKDASRGRAGSVVWDESGIKLAKGQPTRENFDHIIWSSNTSGTSSSRSMSSDSYHKSASAGSGPSNHRGGSVPPRAMSRWEQTGQRTGPEPRCAPTCFQVLTEPPGDFGLPVQVSPAPWDLGQHGAGAAAEAAADDHDSDSESSTESAGQNTKAKPKRMRPCKSKRQMYSKFVSRVMQQVDSDPTGFNIDEVKMPQWLSENKTLLKKFLTRIERRAETVRAAVADNQAIPPYVHRVDAAMPPLPSFGLGSLSYNPDGTCKLSL